MLAFKLCTTLQWLTTILFFPHLGFDSYEINKPPPQKKKSKPCRHSEKFNVSHFGFSLTAVNLTDKVERRDYLSDRASLMPAHVRVPTLNEAFNW